MILIFYYYIILDDKGLRHTFHWIDVFHGKTKHLWPCLTLPLGPSLLFTTQNHLPGSILLLTGTQRHSERKREKIQRLIWILTSTNKWFPFPHYNGRLRFVIALTPPCCWSRISSNLPLTIWKNWQVTTLFDDSPYHSSKFKEKTVVNREFHDNFNFGLWKKKLGLD